MPITTNKSSEVKLFCSQCYGDGDNDSIVCDSCQGTGRIIMSTQEWMKKHLSEEVSKNSGLFTFEDMMKAFSLGVISESGYLPHEDYMGSEKIIQKYFTPIDNEK